VSRESCLADLPHYALHGLAGPGIMPVATSLLGYQSERKINAAAQMTALLLPIAAER
jgi:hypothetical protein